VELCEAVTAGVASVIAAVDTSPVVMPALWASSSAFVNPSSGPGTPTAVPGPCEMRSSIVLCPVDHAVPVAAESGRAARAAGRPPSTR
jgi:hypothetical protein